MSGVAFLPKELSSSNERSGMLELPSHNVGPLIQAKRKISVRMNPLGKAGVHDSLAGWSDCNWLRKISLSRSGNPCNFWGKAFNMIFLFTESCL